MEKISTAPKDQSTPGALGGCFLSAYPTFSLHPRGVGGALAKKIVTNDDLSATLSTSHEWIETRTGITQRHIVQDDETMSSLAIRAAKKTLEHGGCTAESLDLIVVATSTPDHLFPPSAMRVLQELGAFNAIAFDVNVACSGFLYAMNIAHTWLVQKAMSQDASMGKPDQPNVLGRAMIIGSETMSRLLNWEDRSTAVLFGDGAGALILDLTDNTTQPGQARSGFLGSHLIALTKGYDQLYVSSGPGTNRLPGVICMNGRDVFRHAVTYMEESSHALLNKHGISIQDVDWVVSHQANRRILMAVAERLGIPEHKVVYSGARHANTSAASIPLALEMAWREKKCIQPGQLVLFQAFGAGFTCATCLIRF